MSKLYYLKEELDFKSIDYSDIDYSEVEFMLKKSPAIKYLISSEDRDEEKKVHLNDKGQHEYILEGKPVIIPEEYSSAVVFSYKNFVSSIMEDNKIKQILKKMWLHFGKLMRSVFGKKKTVYNQIKYIINNSNKIYQELRDYVYELNKKYGNDKMFDILFLLPDLFIYICRLQGDIRVPKGYKVELILSMIYLLSPIDFIPEGLINHPIALVDDVGIILYVVRKGFNNESIPRAALEDNWPGDVELVYKIEESYQSIVDVIGEDLIETIYRYHSDKKKKAESS